MKAKDGDPNGGPASRRLPLIFGVSGHRDLFIADVPQLRDRLLQIFARFRAAYPHTPFRLLTPLAEGADRLTAEVALASEISLFVPLPMERQEYERDFTTAESLAEFRALLAMAESHWEIPIATNPGTESRIKQYAEVGDFIARHSHVLILLWDGGDNKKVGGTAWVKKRREHWLNAASDPSRGIVPLGYGPTIQVVTPRASGRLPRPRPATIGELPPSAAEFAVTLSKRPSHKSGGNRQKRPPLYQLVYWAIDSFNADVPGSSAARNRKKRQSATRSRL
ncbi:MAG TPA: hypothetical protein VF345_06510 [Chthoniobacterales bacterium]